MYNVLPSDVEQCACGAAYTGLSCEVSKLDNSFQFHFLLLARYVPRGVYDISVSSTSTTDQRPTSHLENFECVI